MIRNIAAATLALALATAPAAHADDDAYIAELQANGVPLSDPGGGTGRYVSGGYTICAQLRNGESPQAASSQFGRLNQWGPVIVAAAQHNLCPDTLH